MKPSIGSELDGIRLIRKLGEGATGIVFYGERENLPLAVKVLSPGLTNEPLIEQRFKREAAVLSKLSHPNVVAIKGASIEGQFAYIAMEYVEGDPLSAEIRSKAPAAAFCVHVMRAVMSAAAHAHEYGVIHRDIKPTNILLENSEDELPRVVVADFGLAKLLSLDEFGEDQTLTRRGRIVGTPAYMAPEQVSGISIGPSADVYSLGILMFELISGRRPFEHKRRRDMLRAHLFERPPALSAMPEVRLHSELEKWIERALEKEPADRFEDAGAMLEAFEALDPKALQFTVAGRNAEQEPAKSVSVEISAAERAEALKKKTKNPVPITSRAWVRGLVWAAGFGLLSAVAAIAGYSTTLR